MKTNEQITQYSKQLTYDLDFWNVETWNSDMLSE